MVEASNSSYLEWWRQDSSVHLRRKPSVLLLSHVTARPVREQAEKVRE